MKELIKDEITYRIGKNAAENTQLIKDSDQGWHWFHLDKFPSCHVVVCTDTIDDSMIQYAAELVKENSKYKFKNIAVCYCKVDNLKHGTNPGSVFYVSNRKVKITYC